MLSNSETFLLNGEKSVAYQIARRGYDVWLGNNRGTNYSRKHVNYDLADKETHIKYFDFSFVELAKYDVPCMIDFVLT